MRIFILLLLIISVAFCFTACRYKEETNMNSYADISQEEAKEIMDTQNDYVVVDARTQQEYDEGHIKGAIMIPEYDIKNQAEDILPDKDKLIMVYCRSGRRSEIASKALAEMGYKNVKNFGGIIGWKYEIEK